MQGGVNSGFIPGNSEGLPNVQVCESKTTITAIQGFGKMLLQSLAGSRL